MALLQTYLEQISLSAKSIAELEFPPPRPFTNALLHNQEITALIRDTEPHERGLFSVDPSIRNGIGQARSHATGPDSGTRRRTVYNAGQSQASAVARVLGSDMLRKIQLSNRQGSRGRGVDIEVLLEGAEKLCAAFDVPGTTDRVAALRQRHDQISASIQRYEGQVSQQQMSLNRYNDGGEHHPEDAENTVLMADMPKEMTEDDLRAEADAVRELEAKKKALEARVAGMERDLGGLLR